MPAARQLDTKEDPSRWIKKRGERYLKSLWIKVDWVKVSIDTA